MDTSILAKDKAEMIARLRDKTLVIQHPERDRIADEIERLRDLAAALMAHLDQLPVKHPQQGERRNELRAQFDGMIGNQQSTTVPK